MPTGSLSYVRAGSGSAHLVRGNAVPYGADELLPRWCGEGQLAAFVVLGIAHGVPTVRQLPNLHTLAVVARVRRLYDALDELLLMGTAAPPPLTDLPAEPPCVRLDLTNRLAVRQFGERLGVDEGERVVSRIRSTASRVAEASIRTARVGGLLNRHVVRMRCRRGLWG